MPESGGEHPLMQTLTGVPERGFEGVAFTGAEAIERNREVVHVHPGHGTYSSLSSCNLQPL
jgi:hypothetical protein